MRDPAASLRNVRVQYESSGGVVSALDGVDVDFDAGTSTAIVGRSGSGKSTLISVLALLRQPTSGIVEVAGVTASSCTSRQLAALRSRSIGVVFQSFHLEPSLSATRNVMLPWYFGPSSAPAATAYKRAGELLEILGIGELATRRPHQMSGGQRQRVAIARALFSEPALLLADEPTGNLDEETANGVAETLVALPAVLGTAVVIVTHDPAVAAVAESALELVRGAFSREAVAS